MLYSTGLWLTLSPRCKNMNYMLAFPKPALLLPMTPLPRVPLSPNRRRKHLNLMKICPRAQPQLPPTTATAIATVASRTQCGAHPLHHHQPPN